jgi:hypothetical protein
VRAASTSTADQGSDLLWTVSFQISNDFLGLSLPKAAPGSASLWGFPPINGLQLLGSKPQQNERLCAGYDDSDEAARLARVNCGRSVMADQAAGREDIFLRSIWEPGNQVADLRLGRRALRCPDVVAMHDSGTIGRKGKSELGQVLEKRLADGAGPRQDGQDLLAASGKVQHLPVSLGVLARLDLLAQ